MAKVLVDVDVLGDVGEELEVVVVLRGAVNIADFVVADGDRRRRVAEADAAIGNGQRDRRQLDDVFRGSLRLPGGWWKVD